MAPIIKYVEKNVQTYTSVWEVVQESKEYLT